MKKLIALLLFAATLVGMTACGADTTPGTDPSDPTPAAAAEITEPTAASQTEPGYVFTLDGVALAPGMVYDASLLPEPESVTQIPSCANQGTDNVYHFGTVEVTAFSDGDQEIIYSIYILDANTPTDEGLYLGDGMAQVDALYGTDYEQSGTQVTITKGETLLILLVENDQVISMDYRWTKEP